MPKRYITTAVFQHVLLPRPIGIYTERWLSARQWQRLRQSMPASSNVGAHIVGACGLVIAGPVNGANRHGVQFQEEEDAVLTRSGAACISRAT